MRCNESAQKMGAVADEDTLHPPAGGKPHPSPAGDTFPIGEGRGHSPGASVRCPILIDKTRSGLYPQSWRTKPSPLGKTGVILPELRFAARFLSIQTRSGLYPQSWRTKLSPLGKTGVILPELRFVARFLSIQTRSGLYPQSWRTKPSPLGKVAERSEDG